MPLEAVSPVMTPPLAYSRPQEQSRGRNERVQAAWLESTASATHHPVERLGRAVHGDDPHGSVQDHLASRRHTSAPPRSGSL